MLKNTESNGKKAPPEIIEIKKNDENKIDEKCYVCKHNPETPIIEINDLIKIITVNNGNCGPLQEGDVVKIEDLIVEGVNIVAFWPRIANCWLKPSDCTWVKVCSGCGKDIVSEELPK